MGFNAISHIINGYYEDYRSDAKEDRSKSVVAMCIVHLHAKGPGGGGVEA